jgi:hypothetical protein
VPSLYSGHDADRATAALVVAVAASKPGDTRVILETLDLDDMQAVALTLVHWLIAERGSPSSTQASAQRIIRDATDAEAAG